jgi:hypothetical protein
MTDRLLCWALSNPARYLDHLTNSAALARLAAADLPALGP